MLRHQLPVHSPVPAGALLGAPAGRSAALQAVATLLAREYAAAAVLCGSGTHALRLAIAVAADRFDPAAPVALPAFSCYDLATAGVGVGRPILLYDLDPERLAPEPDSVRRVLEDGARVVVVAPLYGVPVEWEPLERLTAAYGAVLVEDAAQGHGARWRGRPLGVLGALSILSFGRGKGWTGGRGGAVLFRHDFGDDAGSCERGLAPPRESGRDLFALAAQGVLGRPALYGIPASIPWLRLGETVYHEPEPPTGMSRLAAALVLRTRAASAREAEVRRRTATFYEERLDGSPSARPVRIHQAAEPGYLRYPVLIPPRTRTALLDAGRRLGIAPSYPTTLARLPAIRGLLAHGGGGWPGAEALAAGLVTLPTHSLVTGRDRDRILDLLHRG